MVLPFFSWRSRVKSRFFWRVRAKLRKNREISRTPFFPNFPNFPILGDFGTQNGSEIEKFRFFFLGPKWVSIWLGSPLGSFWGHFKVSSGVFRVFTPARSYFERDFASILRHLEKFLVFRPKSKKIAFSDFRFWAPKGFLSGLDGSWCLFGH